MRRLCIGCMNPLDENNRCTICKNPKPTFRSTPRCLQPGTLLQNRYLIGRVLGEGSFGITYISRDLLLDTTVAIKEYFPLSLVSRDVRNKKDNIVYVLHGNTRELYKKGLTQFYNEARILSRFQKLDGIATVYNLFYENNTAYLVMDYVSGITLKKHIEKNGAVSGNEMLLWIKPVIKALISIHNAGMIHRDISPDNLILTEDRQLVLIDFGSARMEKANTSQSMTVTFKRGFTPEEQYLKHGKLGTWSDVYSLCATMYYMLTGVTPNEAIERMLHDKLISLADIPEIQLSAHQKETIMKGISIKPEKRIQNMQGLLDMLYGKPHWKYVFSKILKRYKKRILKFGIVSGLLLICLGICYGINNAVANNADKKQTPSNNSSVVNTSAPAASSVSNHEQTSHDEENEQMPSFIGMTKKKASQKYQSLGDSKLILKWKEVYSSTVVSGTVIKQSILPGTYYKQEEKKTLILTISKGKKETVIPTLVGNTLQTAIHKLKKNNLSYEVIWKNSLQKNGTVIKQSTKKSSAKITIYLTVSTGKKVEDTTPENTTVPESTPTKQPIDFSGTIHFDDNSNSDDFVGTLP